MNNDAKNLIRMPSLGLYIQF